jgi:hypothetical protein
MFVSLTKNTLATVAQHPCRITNRNLSTISVKSSLLFGKYRLNYSSSTSSTFTTRKWLVPLSNSKATPTNQQQQQWIQCRIYFSTNNNESPKSSYSDTNSSTKPPSPSGDITGINNNNNSGKSDTTSGSASSTPPPKAPFRFPLWQMIFTGAGMLATLYIARYLTDQRTDMTAEVQKMLDEEKRNNPQLFVLKEKDDE